MPIEVWKRSLIVDDPAVEINLPVVSIRTRWPFLYWFRDRYCPWSLHVHLPGSRVLSLRRGASKRWPVRRG